MKREGKITNNLIFIYLFFIMTIFGCAQLDCTKTNLEQSPDTAERQRQIKKMQNQQISQVFQKSSQF